MPRGLGKRAHADLVLSDNDEHMQAERRHRQKEAERKKQAHEDRLNEIRSRHAYVNYSLLVAFATSQIDFFDKNTWVDIVASSLRLKRRASAT